jgi:hypothetical protein
MELAWTLRTVSDGRAVPGSPITAVPWRQSFALFVADPNGGIYTTGGDPQAGFGPWTSVSEGASTPGAAVTAVPWGERFAVFIADPNGGVYTTGGDPQGGFGPWASVSEGRTTPGGLVTAVPWGQRFALFLADPNGGIYQTGGDPQGGFGPWASVSEGRTALRGQVTAIPWRQHFALFVVGTDETIYTSEGDPQQGFGPWEPVAGMKAAPGSRVAAAAFAHGLALFITDANGRIVTLQGDKQIATGFTAHQHGWHFNNSFTNQVIGSLLETQGLCGGMAYSSLDYYFAGLPIPTHRKGDFGDPAAEVPPDGRLRTMIFNRLLDSFKDNFGKWSCIYPELNAAVGAALGIVVGTGLGGALGAAGGFIFGELRKVFDCPAGGAAGMTRQELPILTRDFLDKGLPVPIGLIHDEDILHIGASHQVVAYGYSMHGTTMTINIYDNRYPDKECTLTVDARNPGRISQSPEGGSWAGLLVEDGYRPQWPSYGPDIGIASPQSVQLNEISTSPIIDSRDPRSIKIAMVPQQPQSAGGQLTDRYSVQNYGEFPAHYASLGIEVAAPDASQSFAQATAPTSGRLMPDESATVTVIVPDFGPQPGTYTLFAGFHSVPLEGRGAWCRMLYPPATVAVA